MKKNILFVIIFFLHIQFVFSQDIDGLKSIYTKTKVQFVKPDALDRLSIELRQYENSPVPEQDTLLLDTYLSISSGYMANNHFRQAYEVYNKFLIRKENMLSADKISAISGAINSVSEKKQKDESEEMTLLNKVQQLNEENELLESRRLTFKRNFSFSLIVLSSIFALMLVSAGIRMISIRSKLRQSRDRMKNIHRFSIIGNFDNGLQTSMQTKISSIEIQTKELQQILKKQELNSSYVKQANQIISGIDKIIKEIKNRF